MAVAHDAGSESHTGATGSTSEASFSWTHTPTGTPRAAVVFTVSIASTNVVTGVSYGSNAMTDVPYTAVDTDTEPGFVQAWFLDNVASGAQTVTVSRTNNATEAYAVCATVTASRACEVYLDGVKTIAASGTEQTAASSSGTGISSNWGGMTLDDGSPGTNSQRYMGVYFGSISPPSSAAGTSFVHDIDLGSYGFKLFYQVTPSQGAAAVSLNAVTLLSDDLAAVGLAIREIASATARSFAVLIG